MKNASINKGCLQPWKKDLTLKTPQAILNIPMHRRKSLFMKTSETWPHCFLQDQFLWSYFWRLYCQPLYYFRKNSQRSLKLRTLFPGFFPEHFFPVTFLRRFAYTLPCAVWNLFLHLDIKLLIVYNMVNFCP